jgi:uncharacterized protein YcaQ
VAVLHELSRVDARRLALRAQLLTDDRPSDLLDTVRRLWVLQHDQTRYVVPSADLVLWSRLGSAYSPQDLRDAIDEQRLVHLAGMLRPAEDVALFTAEMAEWPGTGELLDWQESRRDWLTANAAFRDDIVEQLRGDGPLPARDLADTSVVPWTSSGWNDDRNVTMMLAFLAARGDVAIAGWDGGDKLWDLAERVYPPDPPVPTDEARRRRHERRLRSLGIARGTAAIRHIEPLTVAADVGEAATVEGIRGRWRVDPALLDGGFSGRTALLSPLDRLVFDRKRLVEIFEFDYQLEMYKPAAKRRWGYYALPILSGDRLVGKLDAQADPKAGLLRVHAVYEDEPFDARTATAVDDEIHALADWLGLRVHRG